MDATTTPGAPVCLLLLLSSAAFASKVIPEGLDDVAPLALDVDSLLVKGCGCPAGCVAGDTIIGALMKEATALGVPLGMKLFVFVFFSDMFLCEQHLIFVQCNAQCTVSTYEVDYEFVVFEVRVQNFVRR